MFRTYLWPIIRRYTVYIELVKLQIVMLAGVTCVRVELRWRVCVEVICVCVQIKDNKAR